MPVRSASAVWNGTLKEGSGTMRLGSGAYEGKYSFGSRFEESPGTNPEELIAAAHAGCFAMALSHILGNAGHTAERLAATAAVSLEQVDGKWTVTAVHLDLKSKVPGIDRAKFEALAEEAKANCPVSRVLNAKITLAATLEG